MVEIAATFKGLPPLPALKELMQSPQWVSWTHEFRAGSHKPTKPPMNPHTGSHASHSNPRDWGTYEQAVDRTVRDGLHGVGFVLTEADDITGVDLDKCLREDGSFEPWVEDLLALRETYTEVSPSGRGIRMLIRGKVEATIKADPLGIEIYRDRRYLTITGNHVAGTPTSIEPAPRTLEALHRRLEPWKREKALASLPAPAASNGGQGGPIAPASGGTDFFRNVNTHALRHLGRWVPLIFPGAKYQPATGAYRVSPRDLGRNLQEDLSLSPLGIKDFGIADMGDARGGRRLPIDIVMAYVPGIPNAKAAAMWLCERLGFTPAQMGWQSGDPFGAAIAQAISARFTTVEAHDAETGEVIEANPSPSTLFVPDYSDMGGIGSSIANWMASTAPRPSKEFAFITAMAVLAVIFGRRFTTPTSAPVNLYLVGLGVSGSGKDHALKAVRHLLLESGLEHLLGPSDFSSDSALELMLRRRPCVIATLDEVGVFLQGVSNQRSGSHEQRIRKTLLELYGLGMTGWSGKQTADREKATDTIWYPTFSFMGFSTPTEFYDGIDERNLKDGFLARPIFVALDKRPELVMPPGLDLPPQLSDTIRRAAAWLPDGARAGGGAAARVSTMKPVLTVVPFANAESKTAFFAIARWQEAEMDRRPDADGLVNRAAENALRMATLRALSRMCINPEVSPALDEARVTVEDIAWAEAIVRTSLAAVGAGISEHMAGSEFERLCKAIVAAVKKTGARGIANSALLKARGVAKAENRMVDGAIKRLIDTHEIVQMPRTGVGRPGSRWIYCGDIEIDTE